MYLMVVIALYISLHFYAISGNPDFRYFSMLFFVFTMIAFIRNYRKQSSNSSPMERLDLKLMLEISFKQTKLYLGATIISFVLFIVTIGGYMYFVIDNSRSVSYVSAAITGVYIISYVLCYIQSNYLLQRQKEHICGYRNR